MRVFYGPSAVSIAVKREDTIDRQPSVALALNASLTSGEQPLIHVNRNEKMKRVEKGVALTST